MIVTVDWIKKNYAEFNNRYFNNILPSNLTFKISRSKSVWGYASYKYDYPNDTIIPQSITISNYYDSPEHVKKNTLLHEMIHIYDYTINPQHFIRNGRKVKYNAHGWFFNEQAIRLRQFGWDINTKVTTEEKVVSSLSESTKQKRLKCIEEAIVVVIRGEKANWMIKTNKRCFPELKSTICNLRWGTTLGVIKDVRCYSIQDEKFASMRSQAKHARGWKLNNEQLMNKLESLKATEIQIGRTRSSLIEKMNKKPIVWFAA
jgi:hypothetical protein